MKTIYDHYTIYHNAIPTYFAGANTGEGFVSAYDGFAREENNRKVYILKGGSGTGKSTFMEKVLTDASSYARVRYLCSADPDSLDAIVIGGDIVVLDGTAPHVREMEYPGAVSELIYMGKYWKREVLETHRREIIELCRQKRETYRRAYHMLAALSLIEKGLYADAQKIVDKEKIRRFWMRVVRGIPKAERKGQINNIRTWALGIKGAVRTDGLWKQASTIWEIADAYQSGTVFLSQLEEICRLENIPVILSRHPIGDRVVEAFIPPLSLLITMGIEKDENPSDKTISMRRFIKKEPLALLKGEIRLQSACAVSLLGDALTQFRLAGEKHMALEGIYKAAMDYPALNRDTSQIRKQILKTLENA